MSIATMTTMASRTNTEKPNDKAALDTQMGTIAAYIPSEILAAYTTALGVTATLSSRIEVKWLLYGGTLVVMLIFVVLRYANERKEAQRVRETEPTTPLPDGVKQFWVVVLAAVSFTAYVMALPGSPFGGDEVNIGGGLAVIVLALLMPQIGKLVGVSPKPSA